MINLSDIRFAFRMLTKYPGFTAVAVTVLAVGIGVNTTVFTFVNAVVLRGLPFENPQEIMHIEMNHPKRGTFEVSVPDLEDWRTQSNSFVDLAGFTSGTMNVSDSTRVPERYSGSWMTSNAFQLIGQQALLGRDFLPDEDELAAQDVVLLGFSAWQNRYGGNPDILGTTIRVNEVPREIVGIMPEGMRFPVNADLWIPLKPEGDYPKRDFRDLEVFGRLRQGVSQEAAQEELSAISARLAEKYPDTNESMDVQIKAFNEEYNGGEIKLVFLAMMGAVGFVLLIACANVANLLLARSAVRGKEVSIRSALGASRGRIVRQLLLESLALGVLAGALGMALSLLGVKLFEAAVANIDKPYWIDFSIDLKVMAFLCGICLLTAVFFGLVPALHATRTDLNPALQESGRGNSAGVRGRRLASGLIIGQVALALVLLVGAGLMVRSLLNTYNLEIGIPTENILTMRLGLPAAKYPGDDLRINFHESLRQRLQSIAGVESAAVASHPPLGGSLRLPFLKGGQVVPEGEELRRIRALVVGPDYFPTVGSRLISGRLLSAEDGKSGRNYLVVNEAFARQHFADSEPVGQRLKFGAEEEEWRTVIGVVSSVRQNGPSQEEIEGVVYRPYRTLPLHFMTIIARTQLPPESLVDTFRQEVRAVDADLPVYNIQTLDEALEQARWPYRIFGTLFSIFAVIALLMSAVGIYGVISYTVTQRTQEIGVRRALGASDGSILGLVVRQGILKLALGLGLGLAGAFGLSRVLASLLVRIEPTDLLTFSLVTVLLGSVTILACTLPALRAARLDPIRALRTD